jgi:hypothetical protein
MVMHSGRIGSTSPAEAPAPHVVYPWAYHAQEEDNNYTIRPAAYKGAWGSVVLDDDGVVRGFTSTVWKRDRGPDTRSL